MKPQAVRDESAGGGDGREAESEHVKQQEGGKRMHLDELRTEMSRRSIDVYVVPTSDFHNSEYVGDYFKARAFLTGFTGSAGTAVVTADKAGLWTDGRYFIQAAEQLAGSGFSLYRMNEEGVPTVGEFVKEALPEGGTIGFDGRVVNTVQAESFRKIASEKHGALSVSEDLVGLIWKDRPALPCSPLWILTEEYSGESAVSKLSRIRGKMAEERAEYHLISSLYDIAWILNLRADDIRHVPVFLSYLLIGPEDAVLYVQPDAVSDEVEAYLRKCGVHILPYEAVYESLAGLPGGTSLLMDLRQVSWRITSSLPTQTADSRETPSACEAGSKKEHRFLQTAGSRENPSARVTVIDKENPSELMKAVKNETEINNTRIAHVKDGVAMTRFMCWLKTNVGRIEMDEYTVGAYLDSLRAGQEHFLDLSFDDICACGSNAAMMHYAADRDSAAVIRPEGMLLVDSGGHYLEGTTDITRTFILGPVTPEMKLHFTTVVRCNLALANLRFLYGCGGISMDVVCREPLWELGLDYKCGTGHGVGHILNVHEGPNGFRYKAVPERRDGGVLEAGMITTDEPGVYIEGKYGIRIENELLCVKDEKNEYGQFLRFEPLTYCPIDLDGIDPELMSEKEIRWLNAYHRLVREKIAPCLTEEENAWLKVYTRQISRSDN